MLAEEDKPEGSPILRIAVDVPAGLSELETLPAESSSQAVWHDIVLSSDKKLQAFSCHVEKEERKY